MELTDEMTAEIAAKAVAEYQAKQDKEIVKRFTPGNDGPEPETQGFKSLGEQLHAVMRAKSGAPDPRLKSIVGNSEGVPADGGFLVQTDFATQLLEKTFNNSDIVNRVFRIPISANANAIKIPAVSDASRADGSRWGGIRAYWMNEGGSKTESNPSFAQVSLELKKLIGYCTCTDELLQDASALESWISKAFAAEFDFKIADAIINGDGAGKPLGILNSPCLVTVTAETGQGASTIVFENIVKMWASRFGPNTSNYVWLINQNIEPQLYTMGLAVGAGGGPVYLPPGGLSVAPYGTLMGRPVIPCEQCASLGTAGDIILADLSQYVMIDKGSMQSASSIHVNFQTDQTAFRFVYRCDGQPMWSNYLTPYKGSTSYQSPFIVLSSTRT
ncbi:MAG: phage major capsid protein [Dehalococcoidales bacterium]|nr:phage major capsid protein [Dehalococcoidales bacterium]